MTKVYDRVTGPTNTRVPLRILFTNEMDYYPRRFVDDEGTRGLTKKMLPAGGLNKVNAENGL